MDEFLQDINTLVYQKWILSKHYNQCNIYQKDEETINIETKYGLGHITFYEMNIIELEVINKLNNKIVFFLHFQMNNMKHAVNLFDEMMQSLLTLVEKPKTRLLLCCSGGMTTSYFVTKIQDVIEVLEMDYEVAATGYSNLINLGEDYDVILLAPQVSYMYTRVAEAFKNKILLNIPAQIFAKYDVKGLLLLVDEAINKKKTVKAEKKHKQLKEFNSYQTYLCISLFRNSGRVHIAYRVYNGEIILISKEIIKPSITIQDIYDVIDTVLLNFPAIKTIGFSAPGIINDGYASDANINGFYEMNYKALFNRYNQRFIIFNDVNAAVIGYHALHSHYESLVLLFQPMKTCAGAGIMINHQLVKGKHNVAGEMQYLSHNDDKFELYTTFEGMVEEIKRLVSSMICTIGPELVVIFCTMLPHIEDLQKALEKEIPKEYIPTLRKIDDIQEYIFLGLMILCNEEIV
ncbi:MAG: ROK family protein [Erysipelotrichaceae bacterium]|nr:ROK family protein [Erysipelotrichaceae bacterium]